MFTSNLVIYNFQVLSYFHIKSIIMYYNTHDNLAVAVEDQILAIRSEAKLENSKWTFINTIRFNNFMTCPYLIQTLLWGGGQSCQHKIIELDRKLTVMSYVWWSCLIINFNFKLSQQAYLILFCKLLNRH